jgi:general secretion pathway protein K
MSGLSTNSYVELPVWPVRNEQGVALIIVLWMLALLTVIANSMVVSIRSEVQVAGNQVATARTEAAADAGVFRAVAALSLPATDSRQWQGNGIPHEWSFADTRMTITVFDEGGKVDLNTAPESLLASLFRSVGVESVAADNLADAIADWRDVDDLRRPHGAERDDYVAAGVDYGPRNGNFESIEELRQVLGMSDELYRRVAPLVTVYSGQTGVDCSAAPRGVLLAVPGATPEQVDAYLAQRLAWPAQDQSAPAAPFAQGAPGNRVGNTFSVQVHAVLGENKAHFFREAVVQLKRDAKEPVVILAWRSMPFDFDPISINEAPN